MNEYFKDTIKTIEHSLESICEEKYEELVKDCKQALKKGGKIVASGLGKNVPICEKFIGTLNSFGIPAGFLHSNTAVHGDLGIIKQNDVVIVLSKSGNTRESIELIEYMKPKHCVLWIMTFNENCKMSKYTDKRLCMHLDHEGDLWDIAPNNSATTFLIVLQALAVRLCKEMNITLEDFKQNHPGGGIGATLRGENG